jgi:hypothetical protein
MAAGQQWDLGVQGEQGCPTASRMTYLLGLRCAINMTMVLCACCSEGLTLGMYVRQHVHDCQMYICAWPRAFPTHRSLPWISHSTQTCRRPMLMGTRWVMHWYPACAPCSADELPSYPAAIMRMMCLLLHQAHVSGATDRHHSQWTFESTMLCMA